MQTGERDQLGNSNLMTHEVFKLAPADSRLSQCALKKVFVALKIERPSFRVPKIFGDLVGHRLIARFDLKLFQLFQEQKTVHRLALQIIAHLPAARIVLGPGSIAQ
jgi:hypothetical protein